MPTFDLTCNPFFLLRLPLAATAAEVVAAWEEALLAGGADEETLLRAQQDLLGPRTRLEAEVAWLVEASPELARKITAAWDGTADPAQLETFLPQVGGLARANLAADLCGRRPVAERSLRILVETHRDLDPLAIGAALDRARQSAGLPLIRAEHLASALADLAERHALAVLEALAATVNPAAGLDSLIENVVNGPAEAFLAVVMRAYRNQIDPQLHGWAEGLRFGLLCLDAEPEKPEPAAGIREQLRQWAVLAGPAIRFEARHGLNEPVAESLYDEIRKTYVWLTNDKGQHRTALLLAQTVHDFLKDLPAVQAQVPEDVAIIQTLVTQEQDRATEAKAVESRRKKERLIKVAAWAALGAFLVWAALRVDPGPVRPPSTTWPLFTIPTIQIAPLPTFQVPPEFLQPRIPPSWPTIFPEMEDPPPEGFHGPATRAQVRYCVDERARLDYLDSLLAQGMERDWLAALETDYRTRCLSLECEPEDLAAVEAELPARRLGLFLEAYRRAADRGLLAPLNPPENN